MNKLKKVKEVIIEESLTLYGRGMFYFDNSSGVLCESHDNSEHDDHSTHNDSSSHSDTSSHADTFLYDALY